MSSANNLPAIRKHAEEAAADLPALMAEAYKAVESVLHGDHAQRKAGAGEKFWQFREYAPHDRPQDIDWRQSAKTDRVYIRQKEWQTPQSVIFWCSRSASMNFSSDKKIPTKAQTAQILTLALAILMTRAGEQVGIFGTRQTGRSEAALERIGNALCCPDNEEELPNHTQYQPPKNAGLVQIGDFLSPHENIENTFNRLSPQTTGGFVIQVLDPAEIELPYHGRMIFEDPTKKIRETVNHVPSVRDVYKQRVEDHINNVAHLCRQNRWAHILHRTDTPLKDTLAKIWADISHDKTQMAGAP